MPKQTIIADTSCLIVLATIDELDLLKRLFGSIIITNEVAEEFGSSLPKWVEIVSAPVSATKAINVGLGKGEASSIALGLESRNECLLILDDLRARKYARNVGLKYMGTIGIIAKAENDGVIRSGMMLIEKIQQTNFRLSEKILSRMRKLLK